MKFARYLVFAGSLAVACGNPQKQDARNAESKANEAAQSAAASEVQQAASDANAVNAVKAAIQSNINDAMSKIAMPDFKKNNAKSFANDFHKYLSELVNANSGKKAGEYMDKLTALRQEYDKKADKLDPADKEKLKKYVNDMLNAVQNANP
ncbi:hypothetical protein [Chitinophaga sp. Cy-1792]|uniref:hypothetical protein n=1 Tax=Chitinophaga sp. Cy-1792 TaxID=2608339 RepID=UPI00141D7553|nr:hypothetical protein [Chitinophaga sp. Cy-1792]NIG56639.1 hypothetical protein [Chitinophaga sp. Cy-1792]